MSRRQRAVLAPDPAPMRLDNIRSNVIFDLSARRSERSRGNTQIRKAFIDLCEKRHLDCSATLGR